MTVLDAIAVSMDRICLAQTLAPSTNRGLASQMPTRPTCVRSRRPSGMRASFAAKGSTGMNVLGGHLARSDGDAA